MAIAELAEPEPEASEPDALARLIRQQRDDDQAERLRPSRWQVRECDLGERFADLGGLDALPDPCTTRRRGRPEVEDGFYLVGIRVPFEAAIHDAIRAGICECPACHGSPKWGELCIICDRCDLDGKVELPGLDVDERPDFEYIKACGLNTTRYRRGPLAGGVGTRKGA